VKIAGLCCDPELKNYGIKFIMILIIGKQSPKNHKHHFTSHICWNLFIRFFFNFQHFKTVLFYNLFLLNNLHYYYPIRANKKLRKKN